MRKLVLNTLFIVSILFSTHSALGVTVFYTGNDLYSKLQDWKSSSPSNAITAGAGAGYVVGIADAVNGKTAAGGKFCLPQNVNVQQLIDVAYNYLNANPQERHLTASSIVVYAFSQAFPCK